jgi:hypothetical protein
MLPYSYNSNYQIVQTKDVVLIYAGNDPRRTDHSSRWARPHLPSSVRRWMGDFHRSLGGNTLVVDTTNFNDAGGFYGDAAATSAGIENLHLIERLSLFEMDTLLYQFEVDNPTAFVQPWKGELTLARTKDRIFEYACHEGKLFAGQPAQRLPRRRASAMSSRVAERCPPECKMPMPMPNAENRRHLTVCILLLHSGLRSHLAC